MDARTHARHWRPGAVGVRWDGGRATDFRVAAYIHASEAEVAMRYLSVLAASVFLTACASSPDRATTFNDYPEFQLDSQKIAAVEASAINYSGKVIWVSPPVRRVKRH